LKQLKDKLYSYIKMTTSNNYKIFTEEPNIAIINELLTDTSLPTEVYNIVAKYKKKLQRNKLKVQYKQKYKNIGRYFPIHNDCISFTYMGCELRNTICDGLYYDIDMKNCLPYLCYQICRDKKIKRGNLKKYIMNRDKLFEELQTLFTIERWKCKNLINRIMNGGGIKKWYEEFEIEVGENEQLIPKWVFEFKQELSEIYNALYDIYYDKYKIVIDKNKTEYENKVRLVSIMLQDKENDLLQLALQYCEDKKFEVGAIIYDGFLLKVPTEQEFDIDDMSEYVNENGEYHISWEIKPMDEKIIYEEEDEKDDDWTFEEDKGYEFDASYCCMIKGSSPKQTYKRRKKYLENFLIETYSPEILFHLRNYKLNIITTYKRPEIIVRLEDVYSGIMSDGTGREFTLSEMWLKDHTKRKKEIYNWVPINPTNNNHLNKMVNNAYNIWTGFSTDINLDYSNENILTLWKEIVHNLCGGVEEHTHYYTCYLAQIVQDPANKCGVAIGFKSQQGEGKGLHLEAVGRVIGLDHYYSSEKIEQVFCTHSEAFAKRLLVNIDETNNTHKYIDALKTKITEPRTPLNIKYQREIMIELFARIIFTQNNNNISFDCGSGDRRFVMFESNNKNLKYKHYKDGWKPIKDLWETPEHTKALFTYLNNYNIDIDLVNDRPITELYKQLLYKNKPMILEFFNNWINGCNWRYYDPYELPNELCEEPQAKEYDELFNTELSIKCVEFKKEYNKFLHDNGCEFALSTQKIYGLINNYNLPILQIQKRKDYYYVFNPKIVWDYMSSRNFNNVMVEEDKPKTEHDVNLFKLY
jgi:hypothetical protein